jgi:P-type Cu2+ transporter
MAGTCSSLPCIANTSPQGLGARVALTLIWIMAAWALGPNNGPMNLAGVEPIPAVSSIPSSTGVLQERCWAVSGMHCAACAQVLRDLLERVPGVQRAKVGYGAGLAWVLAPEDVQAQLPAWGRQASYRLAPMVAAEQEALQAAEARTLLWRLFVAAFCMMQVMMLAAPTYFAQASELPLDLRQLLHWGSWVLSTPVMLWSAQPFWQGAWRGLRTRRLGMELPIALAALITYGVSTLAVADPAGPWGPAVYFDSLTMFIAFLLGARWFELKARHGAALELARLTQQAERPVQRETASGGLEAVALQAVRNGDVLRVELGEPVPVDSLLLEGHTWVDESLLSGESVPLAKGRGALLVGGSLNLGQPVRVQALASAAQGRAAQLAQGLQMALTERPEAQTLADRWASLFMAGVLVLALSAAWVWWRLAPERALEVACAVLIVTCPCAFALAQPAARLASHRRLARQGVLLQRFCALQALASITDVWFDKTGTLTRPEAQAHECQPGGLRHLGAAVQLAAWSRHPVAQAVARVPAPAPGWRWHGVEELPGRGLRVQAPDARWWLLVARPDAPGAQFGPEGEPAQLVFDTTEQALPQSQRWLQALRQQGLGLALLSGDRPERVQTIAQALGIEQAQGACTPEQKHQAMVAAQRAGRRVLMVGDGVNDAPVLAQADASVAVAGASALASRAADAVLMEADLFVLPSLLREARRCQARIGQNLVWSAAYNLLAVPLALTGYLPPWAAGLGMALSSLFVVLNALR